MEKYIFKKRNQKTWLKDTHSIDSRDLEVVNELDDGFPVGVRGVAVSHLEGQTDTQTGYLSHRLGCCRCLEKA